MYIYCLSISIV